MQLIQLNIPHRTKPTQSKKQKIKESGRKLNPELLWVLAQRISFPNSCLFFFFSLSPSTSSPFRFAQHFFFPHI